MLDHPVTIPAGSGLGPGVCLFLKITGDDVREDTESFFVTFRTMNSLDALVGGSTITVNILDNGDGACLYYLL